MEEIINHLLDIQEKFQVRLIATVMRKRTMWIPAKNKESLSRNERRVIGGSQSVFD
jgi:hypothetical protein